MSYADKLRDLFPEISLNWEDLLLLETFQVTYLPNRVNKEAFASLLQAYPVVHRFLLSKHPSVKSFLNEIIKEHPSGGNSEEVEKQCQEALWEIADLIIYNKDPERFDALAPIKWEIDEIKSICSLGGKAIADVGAGAGRIAFLVAPHSETIFAVEPVTSLRTYMKEKALQQEVKNLYVMDGTLDSIPLPNHLLDVLITSNAIGWNLQEELEEIERVVKPGGHAIHLLQSKDAVENPYHEVLVSSPWNYNCIEDEEKVKFRYYKSL